jgi:uncharacterized protein
MIHPDTEIRFVNPQIGFGVFATRDIPKGTITWARDPLDLAFTDAEVERLGPLYRATLDKYSFVDGIGEHVLCWDIARYLNHSCNAACLAAGYGFELAVRDIAAGEELCDDYGTLNLLESFECLCNHPECRGTVGPQDFERYADLWDEKLRSAFGLIQELAQPLMPLVAPHEKAAIGAGIADPAKIASCRAHFWNGQSVRRRKKVPWPRRA